MRNELRQMGPPPFNINSFPFNMDGPIKHPSIRYNAGPMSFQPSPWDMLMGPPLYNNIGAYNHNQYSFWKPQQFGQPYPQTNFLAQSQPNFTNIFNNLDGKIKTFNKYYPYVKKAGPILTTISKMF
jgi:hypothetical protein